MNQMAKSDDEADSADDEVLKKDVFMHAMGERTARSKAARAVVENLPQV